MPSGTGPWRVTVTAAPVGGWRGCRGIADGPSNLSSPPPTTNMTVDSLPHCCLFDLLLLSLFANPSACPFILRILPSCPFFLHLSVCNTVILNPAYLPLCPHAHRSARGSSTRISRLCPCLHPRVPKPCTSHLMLYLPPWLPASSACRRIQSSA